ncbi:primosomal protein N' [uncultured Desulfobacter sp.]|uniref:primosomal protein N' n=1 Tax=uncultured Desulfobacter sp. TaxID=240139 RepID=UPI002AAB7770|nr:primosomal protein N' [uncultured Desulfobacter sp.]
MSPMISTDYIEVAVTLPVNQTFVYRIPDKFRDDACPGMRVLVPFGRRRVTGYILEEKPESGPYKTKEVLDLLDDHPLFPESDIEFFKWVANYYIYPLGDTIKAAMPAGLDCMDVVCAFATVKGAQALDAGDLAREEARIIGLANAKNGISLKALSRRDPAGAAVLRRLEKKDLVQVTAVLQKETAGIKTEKFISLPEKLQTQQLRMSAKRQKILAMVREAGEVSLTSLKRHVPTAPNLIKPMAEAGWLNVVNRRVFRDPLGDPVTPDTPPELTQEQNAVVKQIQDRGDVFSPCLLVGVTGSGKTEVYMRLVADAVAKGKGAIVLVPEIALISQTERRFRARFGENIAVIHSMLSQGERLDQWRKISHEKVNIVIGARSAIFTPIRNIGIIIVDEEHDYSYKQESGLRYNARDLAVVRAKMHNCPVVLGSATPSVQSCQNVMSEKFFKLELTRRVNNQTLPDITLVDMKKYQGGDCYTDRIITPELGRAVRSCLEKGNQALIFLNRRGFSTFPLCASCGKTLGCPHCDVTMTFHKGEDQYKCHLCGHVFTSDIRCPDCGTGKIRNLGFGTEKIESMLKTLFPDARVARVDQDSTAKKGSTLTILRQIRNRTVDIIVGTQMLAKGHDFPSITLVGVICADLSLSLPDFRASERTFQLLAQVAGRAGRGQEPGRVIMQTFNPDHFTIQAARNQDYLEFFNQETPFRKALTYPPFSRMIQLKISGKNAEQTRNHAQLAAEILGKLNTREPKAQILGPIEAAIQKISSRFRWQILVKGASSGNLSRLVSAMVQDPVIQKVKSVSIAIDVDPYSLL